MVLTSAYGRKYKTKADVIRDYEQGKDFILNDVTSPWHGKYCSCRDFIGRRVELRYGKINQHLIIHVIYE